MAYKRRESSEQPSEGYGPTNVHTFIDMLKRIDPATFSRMMMHSGLLPLEQRAIIQAFRKLA